MQTNHPFSFRHLSIFLTASFLALACLFPASHSFGGVDQWIVNGTVGGTAGTAGDDTITTDPAGGNLFQPILTGTGNDTLTFGTNATNDPADVTNLFILFEENGTAFIDGDINASGAMDSGIAAIENLEINIGSTGSILADDFAIAGFENLTVNNHGFIASNGSVFDFTIGGGFVAGSTVIVNNYSDGIIQSNTNAIVCADADSTVVVMNEGDLTAASNGVLSEGDATVINYRNWVTGGNGVNANFTSGHATVTNYDNWITGAIGVVAFSIDVMNYGYMEAQTYGLVSGLGGFVNYYGAPGSELISLAANAIDASDNTDTVIIDNASVIAVDPNFFAIRLYGGDDLVRIIGHSHVGGIMDGGGQTTADRLEFELFGLCGDTEAEIEALLAGGTFTYWGETYTFVNFEDVTVDGFKFENWAKTYNQKQIAKVFDCIDVPLGDAPDQDVIDFVDTLYAVGEENFPEALNQLSHQRVSEAFSKIAFTNHDFMLRHLNNRSSLVRENATDMWDTSGFTLLDNTLDPKFEGMNAMLTAAKATPYRTGRRAQAPVHQDDNRFGLFLSGNAIMAEGDGTPDIYDYEWDTFGILAGADYKLFPSLAIGILGGYSHTDVDLDNYGSDADIDTYIIGTYANWWWNNFYVNGMFSYCFNQYDGHRNIPFLNKSHTFDTDGDQFNLAASCGYDFHFGNLAIGPIGGIRYTNFSVDGFTEGGHGIDKLTVADDDADSLRTSLGAKATYTLNTKVCAITPEIRAAWGHEFLDDSRGITARFNSDQLHPFTIKTTDPERDWAELGASVRARFNDTVSAFIDYDAQVGQDDFFAHSVNGGLRLEF